ncbi:outer membrane protein [Sphingomonas fuzhouensis]|uniref:outer membrane protein n=1 Tax=Sphingomonas fuzhouensis TaxID=3106033 RepID=UPI002AFDD503|nr:outer membrane beta-barrel protein [Sphingomonas sp. SGZ-02]
MRILFAAALLTCMPAAAFAQEKPVFTGAYAGPEAGILIHGFRLGDENYSRKYVAAGLAGGGFAGVMLPATDKLRLGGEVAVQIGGGTVRSQQVFSFYEQKARLGYSLTARAGYVLGDRTMVFAEAGYGGYRYDVRLANVIDNDGNGPDGLVGGIGIERQLSRNVAVRLRAQAGSEHGRVLLGLPIRF